MISEKKHLTYILLFIITLYGAGCTYLYYNQLFWTAQSGLFESDLPFHVSMAVDDHWFYSLTAIFYQLFYLTPFGNGLTALFLGIISVVTIFATFSLIEELSDRKLGCNSVLLISIISNVVMPFYISIAGQRMYIDYQSPSIWHNSTYICMKLAGIITFTYFLKLSKTYSSGLKLKEWITFSLLLIICNAIKPSFAMMFLPVMAVFLLIELFRRVPFAKVFIFGLSVIPSLIVILLQNLVLFGNDTGNGIAIAPGKALFMRGDHPKVTFILSLVLPLSVLLFTFKDLIKDRVYGFTWLMWVFGFAEIFLLIETGTREKDSNFFWGYSMSLFFIYLFAMLKLISKIRYQKSNASVLTKVFCSCSFIFLIYQVLCGVIFFVRLLFGTTYWM